MGDVIAFRRPRNMPFRINSDAAAKVGAYVCLRPAPSETPKDFVARIVRAYHEEVGQ